MADMFTNVIGDSFEFAGVDLVLAAEEVINTSSNDGSAGVYIVLAGADVCFLGFFVALICLAAGREVVGG